MMQEISVLRELNMVSVTIRLLLALAAGTLIGIDRGMKRRGAGIKTHVLVCLGATLVMMTGQYTFNYFGQGHDVSRLGAQVISGVGFLGVGTIIVTGRNQVRGLTTAAGLWACACIGLALGIGFYEGAFVMLLLVLLTFVDLHGLTGMFIPTPAFWSFISKWTVPRVLSNCESSSVKWI